MRCDCHILGLDFRVYPQKLVDCIRDLASRFLGNGSRIRPWGRVPEGTIATTVDTVRRVWSLPAKLVRAIVECVGLPHRHLPLSEFHTLSAV